MTDRSPTLEERVFRALQLLQRPGGEYVKAERLFIAETVNEMAVALTLPITDPDPGSAA